MLMMMKMMTADMSILPLLIFSVFTWTSPTWSLPLRCDPKTFTEYLNWNRSNYFFDVSTDGICPVSTFSLSGATTSTDIQQFFTQAESQEHVPEHLQMQFAYFKKHQISCTFDSFHHLVKADAVDVTLLVDFDVTQGQMNLYLSRFAEATKQLTTNKWSQKTDIFKHLDKPGQVKSIVSPTKSFILVYIADESANKTFFQTYTLTKVDQLAFKLYSEGVVEGAVVSLEFEPAGNYVFYTTREQQLFRSKIEYPSLSVLGSREVIQIPVEISATFSVIPLEPRTFLMWTLWRGKRTAVLYEGYFFVDQGGVVRARFSEIACSFTGIADTDKSHRIRLRKTKRAQKAP